MPSVNVVSPATGQVVATAEIGELDYYLRRGWGPQSGTVAAARAQFGANYDAPPALESGQAGVAVVAAPTGVATADTSAIQAAIDAVFTVGGGTALLAAGTYAVTGITLRNRVHLRGAGDSATTIRLASGANTHVVATENFPSLTGGDTTGGPSGFSVADLGIDGNKAQNPSGGHGLAIYGSVYRLRSLILANCAQDGLWSEWSHNGILADGVESTVEGVRSRNNGRNGVTWTGPHDSSWRDVIAFQNAARGFHVKPYGAPLLAVGCHAWGTAQQHAWYLEGRTELVGCQGEGASQAQLFIGANDCEVTGGIYFAGDGSIVAPRGVVIGDATHPSITGTVLITKILDCTTAGLDVTNSGGSGLLNVMIYQASGTPIVGPTKSNQSEIITVNGVANSSRYGVPRGFTVNEGGSNAFLVVGTNQKFNINGSAGRVELANSTDLLVYSDQFSTLKARIFGASGAIRTGTGATASRPAAGTVGQGAQWFDTTLGRPIWSDGTAWRDAAGTVV